MQIFIFRCYNCHGTIEIFHAKNDDEAILQLNKVGKPRFCGYLCEREFLIKKLEIK